MTTMNAALWTVQIFLALLFATSGALKSTWPKARLIASGQTGVAPFPLPVIRLTAVAELLAAIGLIAPRLTGIAPVLTAFAAIGLAVVMVGAVTSHTSLLLADRRAGRASREARNVVFTALFLLLCLFVAVGRLRGV
jgi:uncharacterized membrane protein YphA (DoxX/SURF4 family)